MLDYLKQLSDLIVRSWNALTSLSAGQLRILVIVIALMSLVGGSGLVFFFSNAPVLLTSAAPYFTLNYPSEGLEQLIPKQREGKVIVLYQRLIFDVDYWNVAKDTARCASNARETDCDFLHSSQSWTVIVPSDGSRLKGATDVASGRAGDEAYLTGNSTNKIDEPRDGLQNWEVSNYNQPPGKVELIMIRRDVYGAFQPVRKAKIPTWKPSVDTCQENSVGIVIKNPTAVADVLVHVPQDMLIETDKWKIWKTTKMSESYVTNAYTDHDKIGNVTMQPDTIHWHVGNALLREADQGDTIYHISWRWQRPIPKVPACSNSTASN